MVKKKNAPVFAGDNGSKLVSPELLTSGQKLAITVNPSDCFQWFESPEDRFSLVTDYVYKLFKGIPNLTLELYPEVSSKGRIHFHGYIGIKDIMNFYIMFVPLLIGRNHIEIDTLSQDQKVYETYIKKSVKCMKPLTMCNRNYDDCGCMKVYTSTH